MTFYLVRHGETRLSGGYCGSLNPPLSIRGRRHILSVEKHLKGIPIDMGFMSPQRRAVQTATILNRQLRIPIQKSDLLKEISFGVWEGYRFAEVEKKWPQLARRWAVDPTLVRIPGAESFSALRRRVRRFLRTLKTSASSVLIVAHGASLAALVIELLDRPTRELPKYIQPLGSIRKVHGRSLQWITPC